MISHHDQIARECRHWEILVFKKVLLFSPILNSGELSEYVIAFIRLRFITILASPYFSVVAHPASAMRVVSIPAVEYCFHL